MSWENARTAVLEFDHRSLACHRLEAAHRQMPFARAIIAQVLTGFLSFVTRPRSGPRRKILLELESLDQLQHMLVNFDSNHDGISSAA